MALSNILKEPRREITETAVGLLVVCTLPLADFLFAVWMTWGDPRHTLLAGMEFGALFIGGLIVLLVCIGIFGYGAALIVHAIGEFFCNVLELRGVHLRPRTRR